MPHKVWTPNGNLSQWILDQFEPGYQGWGIDVGASDGISVNTTFALEASHHWTIVSVEANPEFASMLKQCRARYEVCACSAEPADVAVLHVNTQNPEAYSSLSPQLDSKVYPLDGVSFKPVPVPVKTVDQLLEKWEFPQLDLLCADTEGTEMDVLRGCDLARWKPRVVIVESWEPRNLPLNTCLAGFGYRMRGRNVHNSLFVMET